MLGLTLDQMAMMGSLVENDFMKHATHLKEFHYRIGVLRHPMDTVVCVGKYLKEGGSQDPEDIFMAETDQTVRSAYSERLRQSVLQYNRPQINTHFRLRGEAAEAAIKALPVEENPDYPDSNLLRLLQGNGLHDAFRDGRIEPSVIQVLWDLHEMNAGRMTKKPLSYRTPASLNDWISRGKHPGVMLWPLRRRLVETLLHLASADITGVQFRDVLLGDRVICSVRPVDGAATTSRDAIIDELQRAFFAEGSSPEVSKKLADALGSASSLGDTEFLQVASMFACVVAGCGSRYHYYSPLNKEDTMFFVKCVMVSRVLMAGRTEGSDDALSSLALKVAKRLAPNDLCMTTMLSCLGMCLHHMDGLLQIRSLIAGKSGAAPGAMDIKWLDSCDGRLVHAILQICLEARKKDATFDPYDLATTEAQKAKIADIQALPWEEGFFLNWRGDVVAHVPASEKGSLAQMNDMQLDIWDRELVDPEGDAGDDDGAGQPEEEDEDPERRGGAQGRRQEGGRRRGGRASRQHYHGARRVVDARRRDRGRLRVLNLSCPK